MQDSVYKFRGKTKISKLWVYGSLVIHEGKAFIVSKGASISGESLIGGLIEVVLESVGQLVGQRNNSNTEIYEGDIVKWTNNFGEKIIGWVGYVRKFTGFYVLLIKGGSVSFYRGGERNFVWSELEIVGNQTENPEMMKYEYWKCRLK
jgi:hypothetical protein